MEEMSNYSSWLGDFSWSEIGDVSNQKYVHLSFQFINYWMSSILQFMVWFSDKLKNIYSHTKNNWFQFSCHGFSNIPSKQTATNVKIVLQTIEFIRKQQWRYIWHFFPNISSFTQKNSITLLISDQVTILINLWHLWHLYLWSCIAKVYWLPCRKS